MDAENKMVVFKKSHNGFDKNDVMRYIEEMNRRFKETTDSLQREIQELKKKNESVPFEESASELSEQIRLLTKENADLRAQLEELKKNETKEEESALQAPLPVEQKSVSEKIGDLLIFAQSEADKLLDQANEEIRKKQNSSKEEAMRMRDDAALTARTMVEETRASLNQLSETYLKSLTAYTHETVSECEENLSLLRTRLRDIQYKAGESAAKADKDIQALISEAFPSSK